jgi:hypothetical protein
MSKNVMTHICRLSPNTVLVNDILVVKVAGSYRVHDKFQSLTQKEWNNLKDFLVTEAVALDKLITKKINKMLDELNIPRISEN